MPAVRSTMAAILPLVVRRLRLVTLLPAECVLLWLGDADPPHLQGDHDLVVRLQGCSPDQPWWQGGGPYQLDLTERLDVQVRTRLSLDPSGSYAVWLLDATLGHLALRNSVLTALVGGTGGFMPTDPDTKEGLTRTPLRLMPCPAPKPDAKAAAPSWGSETLRFEIDYLQDCFDADLDPVTVLEEDS